MSTCTLKERLHSFALGIIVAVLLMWIGGGMVWIVWATSGSGLSSAPNSTDQLMTERSALLADASVGLPDSFGN